MGKLKLFFPKNGIKKFHLTKMKIHYFTNPILVIKLLLTKYNHFLIKKKSLYHLNIILMFFLYLMNNLLGSFQYYIHVKNYLTRNQLIIILINYHLLIDYYRNFK